MTIRDNVEAVHRLLVEELKVTHLKAVIGFSMGAQQAFQWAVSYPDFADRIVATSGTAKTYPHGIVRLEGQIAALTTDPAFQSGDYTAPPRIGLEAFGMVGPGGSIRRNGGGVSCGGRMLLREQPSIKC
jgi:homoserine O-acetyltransferase